MNKNLGFFTCYGIEYVFDYLGEARINQRIEELKDKPTMGIRLEEFAYRDPEYSYADSKGIFWIFGLLIDWFDDIKFVLFLFESSKKYNEENYLEGGLLKKNWQKHLELMDMMIKRSPDKKDSWESQKINPYWIDYHFFYSTLFKRFKKVTEKKVILELDLLGSYDFNKNKLTGKLALELKTRRKPLTGQYLSYKERFIWYNLEPKGSDEYFMTYEFIKDKNLYSLIVDKAEAKARIELIEGNSYSEEYISLLNDINLDFPMAEMIDNYIGNFRNISIRVRQEYEPYEGKKTMANACIDIICGYLESKNDINRVKEFISLHNSYSDVWREIAEYGEDEE